MSDRIRGQFRANIIAMIKLVGQVLYKDKTAAIRELLANASTAIAAARMGNVLDGDPAVHIWLEMEGESTCLVISDNGVGMSAGDLDTMLPVMGEGLNKALAEQHRDRPDEFVGKYGVGFLTAFMVADVVTVISKCHNDLGHHWESEPLPDEVLDSAGGTDPAKKDLEYAITPCEVQGQGTTVRLHLRPRYISEWKEHEVRKWAREYSRFCKFPIYWGKTGGDLISELVAPWYDSSLAECTDENYRASLPKLGDDFANAATALEFITLCEGDVRGVLYVGQPSQFAHDAPCALDIYCRRQFVKHGELEILPPEFRFVRGIVDCFNFDLDLARERLRTDSPVYKRVGELLCRSILDHFVSVAEQASSVSPEEAQSAAAARMRMDMCMRQFHIGLKHALTMTDDAGAFRWDDKYLLAFAPFMPFHNSVSQLTSVSEYLAQQKERGQEPRILFVATLQEFNNLQQIAIQEQIDFLWLRADAEHEGGLEHAYLNRCAKLLGVPCEQASKVIMSRLKPEEAAAGWPQIIAYFSNRLNHPEFSLSVHATKFRPATVAGRLFPADDTAGKKQLADFIKALEQGIPDSAKDFPLVRELYTVSQKRSYSLYLNMDHPVLKEIARYPSAQWLVGYEEILHSLFHDIVTAVGHPIPEVHMTELQTRVYLEALAALVGQQGQVQLENQLRAERESLAKAQAECATLREQVNQLKVLAQTPELNDEVFFIRRFDNEFDDFISERLQGICEEMKLTLIDPKTMNLPGNVIPQLVDKLRQSGLVIADITPRNTPGTDANVYYEAGFVDGSFSNKLICIAEKTAVAEHRIPFDFITRRQFSYPMNDPRGFDEFVKRLAAAMKEVLDSLKR